MSGLNASIGWLARVGAVALGLSGAALSAQAQEAVTFEWPGGMFDYTLPDELFTVTNETRFEKAERIFIDSMSGIGDELFQIASFPFRDPASFGLFAAGIGALTLIDRPTTAAVQDFVIEPVAGFDLKRPFPILPGTVSEQYVFGAVAGSYAYGLLANDERAQVAALLGTKAFAYSYLTSHVILKAGLGRKRPVSNLSTHTGPTGDFTTSPFDWFQGTGVHFGSVVRGTAMPSFHFTMLFSEARVFSGVYDNYLIPYGVATALLLEAAEGHNHWVSDMVAGAVIGTAIGNVVLKSYENRRSETYGTVMPIVSSDGAGLGFQMSF